MVNDYILEQFCVNGKLFARHRNVPKSMEQVAVRNRLTEDAPHGCNVGIITNGSRGISCGLIWILGTTGYVFKFEKKVGEFIGNNIGRLRKCIHD